MGCACLQSQDPNRYLAQVWRERNPKPPTVADHVRGVWAQVESRPLRRRVARLREPPSSPW